jgi:hypothetical protein
VFVPQKRGGSDQADAAQFTAADQANDTAEETPPSSVEAAAAGRTRLQHLLNHGVLVSLKDRRIARKIWNYLVATYPAN